MLPDAVSSLIFGWPNISVFLQLRTRCVGNVTQGVKTFNKVSWRLRWIKCFKNASQPHTQIWCCLPSIGPVAFVDGHVVHRGYRGLHPVYHRGWVYRIAVYPFKFINTSFYGIVFLAWGQCCSLVGFSHGPGSPRFSHAVPSQAVMTCVSTTASQQGLAALWWARQTTPFIYQTTTL